MDLKMRIAGEPVRLEVLVIPGEDSCLNEVKVKEVAGSWPKNEPLRCTSVTVVGTRLMWVRRVAPGQHRIPGRSFTGQGA